jgi:hypothetical protein
MMRRKLALGFVLGIMSAAAVLAAGGRTSASEDPGPQDHAGAAGGQEAHAAAPTPEEMMTGMKRWLDTIEPGPQHRLLEGSIGEWETISRVWMGGPAAPPTEFKGSATRRWVLGGRFVLEELSSQMVFPDLSGGGMGMVTKPYSGMGLTGYDRVRNVYTTSWADTSGTQQHLFKGNLSPDGRTWTFYGEMDEPMLNVTGRMVKAVTRIIDADHHVFEVYDLHAGENYKPFEIEYRRKKPGS